MGYTCAEAEYACSEDDWRMGVDRESECCCLGGETPGRPPGSGSSMAAT